MSYPSKIFLLGAGGIGMSALGRYFLLKGIAIAGYDRTPGFTTRMLEEFGAKMIFEDDPDKIPAEFTNQLSDVWVIYTPAIPPDMKLMEYFKSNNYSIFKRAEVLGMISEEYITFAVAGTHGKTTTTAALSHILRQCGNDATAFIGGISKNIESNFVNGTSGAMVAEADEYDRSFHYLSPSYSVITSVEPDHLDIYGDYQKVKEAFRIFAKRSVPGGKVIVHKSYSGIFDGIKPDVLTYGQDPASDYYCTNVLCNEDGIAFDFVFPGKVISSVRIPVFGAHNAENAVAAGALAHQFGLRPEDICHALTTFTGVRRRFDVICRTDHHLFVDDYAHHPDELDALTRTLQRHFPGRKYAAIFQPHLYSRTRDFAERFAASLSAFHTVMLLDIYPARELPIPGVNSGMLLNAISTEHKFLVQKDHITEQIGNTQFDILVTIGAGDIDLLIPAIENKLQQMK